MAADLSTVDITGLHFIAHIDTKVDHPGADLIIEDMVATARKKKFKGNPVTTENKLMRIIPEFLDWLVSSAGSGLALWFTIHLMQN